MPTHVTRQGDCFATLATRYGTTVETLRSMNPNLPDDRAQGFILAPGDRITVPARTASGPSFSSGGTKRYRATIPMTTLKVRILGDDARPVLHRPFELRAGAIHRTGSTDGQGFVECRLPATLTHAELRISLPGDEVPRVFELALGHLDPGTESTGLRRRLQNLGYLSDPNAAESSVRAAIQAFERDEGLPETGSADTEATAARLRQRHGA